MKSHYNAVKALNKRLKNIYYAIISCSVRRKCAYPYNSRVNPNKIGQIWIYFRINHLARCTNENLLYEWIIAIWEYGRKNNINCMEKKNRNFLLIIIKKNFFRNIFRKLKSLQEMQIWLKISLWGAPKKGKKLLVMNQIVFRTMIEKWNWQKKLFSYLIFNSNCFN